MRVSVLKGFARHGVRLALLFVCLSVLAGVSHAQAAGAAAQPAAKAVSPAATPAIATPTAQPGQPASPSERKPGGNHEGIHVHGHWVIEVKNPDGKLASHTEFENSLQPSGADALTGLVSGQYVSGGFQIVLSTSATPSVGNSGGSGLCSSGTCTLQDSRTYYAVEYCTSTVAAAGQCGLLTYKANANATQDYTSLATGFTLSGTVVNVPSGGQIQSVATGEAYCANSDSTTLTSTAFVAFNPQQCGATQPGTLPSSPTFDQVILTGATLPLPASGQCGGAGQPECAVTVTAGQSVTVSVQITFGSGDTAAPGSASLPAAKPAK